MSRFTTAIVAVVGLVIVLLIAIEIAPNILNSTANFQYNQYIGNFILLTTVSDFIPLMFILGLLTLAAAVGVVVVRRVRG